MQVRSIMADDSHAVMIYDATSTVAGATKTFRRMLIDELAPDGRVTATRGLAWRCGRSPGQALGQARSWAYRERQLTSAPSSPAAWCAATLTVSGCPRWKSWLRSTEGSKTDHQPGGTGVHEPEVIVMPSISPVHRSGTHPAAQPRPAEQVACPSRC